MEDVLFERNKKFQTHLNESLLKNSDVVIGFDTSSWLLSRRCKLFGKAFVLDQSIAHPLGKLKIYEELRAKYPAWKEDIQVKREEHTLLEQEEYKNADLIVVASAFTKKTLMMGGIPETKIRVNPYGVGQEFFIDRNRDDHHTGCRFLFLGTLGARKGTPFLLDVWRSNEFWKLNSETWLAGPATDEVLGLIDGTPGFSYVGRRPHNAMPDLLRQCDVLVFPSYYEGFGQVILEAMAAGLPVITTDRTAGPDVIIHGEDGMLLRAGSHDDLTQAMLWCIRQPDARKVMGQKAREKAKSFSWDAYGNRWLKILEEVHNFRSF